MSERDGIDTASVLGQLDRFLAAHPPELTPVADFLASQFDAGLAWVDFPPGLGGLGADPSLQPAVTLRLRMANAPDRTLDNIIGYGMAAPTILRYGTVQQQRDHLRRIFTCEEIWCQLFSEPGAGSDLAGLATRARQDGGDWIIDGQKVWTSYAHVSTFGLLLARSDPRADKYRGLTYFILDMGEPGIEVRPLRQMTGDAEFNEVFLSEVRIPDSARLGGVGEGWSVALATLSSERQVLGSAVGERGSGPIGLALGLWETAGDHSEARRDDLMQVWIRAELIRLLNLEGAEAATDLQPRPDGSIGKLARGETTQRIFDLCLRQMGAAGMLFGKYEMRRNESAFLFSDNPSWMFLRTRANTIAGGTSEVLRDVLAERVLGLPREARADKGIPWADIPRN